MEDKGKMFFPFSQGLFIGGAWALSNVEQIM